MLTGDNESIEYLATKGEKKMAKGEQKQYARKSYSVGNQDGYLQISAWETEKADAYAQWKNIAIDRYNVSDQPKLRSITAIVRCPGFTDPGQAEWQAKMLVKAYHPSVWKEVAMAFEVEGGFEVHVKWNIFKPMSQQEA